MPRSAARSTARLEGAPTAASTGQPATAAFWTSSNETRPLTQTRSSASGSSSFANAQPTTLSNALWRPTSSRRQTSSPVAVEESCRVQTAGRRERGLRLAQPLGQRRDEPSGDGQPALDSRGLDRDRLERALAADAARRRGVEASLQPRRVESRARRPRRRSRPDRPAPARRSDEVPPRGRSRARAPRRAPACASSPPPGCRRCGSRAAPRPRSGRAPAHRQAGEARRRGPCCTAAPGSPIPRPSRSKPSPSDERAQPRRRRRAAPPTGGRRPLRKRYRGPARGWATRLCRKRADSVRAAALGGSWSTPVGRGAGASARRREVARRFPLSAARVGRVLLVLTLRDVSPKPASNPH